MKRRYFFLFVFAFLFQCKELFSQQPFTVHVIPSAITAVPAIHSGAFASRGNKWIFIGGRRDGLHIMQAGSAFPTSQRNDSIFIVDPIANTYQAVSARQFPAYTWEALCSSNMQYIQDGQYLYMIGGYGREDSTFSYVTFHSLISVDLDCLLNEIDAGNPIGNCIRQVIDSNLAVAGGMIDKIDSTFYLVFGHRFDGFYSNQHSGPFTQRYTHEIRKFTIQDDGVNLSINNYSAIQDTEIFHRRDFNMVRQIYPDHERGFTVFGGVFQKNLDQPFLTPIDITSSGVQHQSSFNENLNQYTTAALPVYDSMYNAMHTIFFGGMSLYTLDTVSHSLIQDTLVPFVSTISKVMRDSLGNLSEMKMQENMPSLLGTNAFFIFDTTVAMIDHTIDLNSISGVRRVGFIAGGIQSDGPNIGNQDPTSMSRPNPVLYDVFIDKTIDAVAEINVTNDVNNLFVFPNPVTDNFSIHFSIKNESNCDIKLFDQKGKLLSILLPEKKLIGEQKFNFSISELKNGIYNCNVRVDKSIKTVKIILQR
jgi:hypothetical protein